MGELEEELGFTLGQLQFVGKKGEEEEEQFKEDEEQEEYKYKEEPKQEQKEHQQEQKIKDNVALGYYLFTATSSNRGETATHGFFTCNEYQDIYLVEVGESHQLDGIDEEYEEYQCQYQYSSGEVTALRTMHYRELEKVLLLSPSPTSHSASSSSSSSFDYDEKDVSSPSTGDEVNEKIEKEKVKEKEKEEEKEEKKQEEEGEGEEEDELYVPRPSHYIQALMKEMKKRYPKV